MTSLGLLAALASFAVAQPGVASRPPGVALRGCSGVVDRTEECASPADIESSIRADVKREPAPIPGVDPKVFPGVLALVAASLAVGGGAAIAYSFTSTEVIASASERAFRDGVRTSGVGLLVASGFAAAAAMAFATFDPSTGKMRIEAFEKEGS